MIDALNHPNPVYESIVFKGLYIFQKLCNSVFKKKLRRNSPNICTKEWYDIKEVRLYI